MHCRTKEIIVVTLIALKVAHQIEAFAINPMFVRVRWVILATPVPTVSPFQDACMEAVMKALNVIAFRDGKEYIAIFVSIFKNQYTLPYEYNYMMIK